MPRAICGERPVVRRMLINRDHGRWFAGTAVAGLALTGAFALSAARAPTGPSGGSAAGLAFGVLGTTCMVLAALLSARKRVRTWRVGSAQVWLRLHLWLGLLAVPCIWFHSGFALGGALTRMLMAVFYVVIASGVVGLALQQFVPAAMTRRVPLETILGQMDEVLAGLATDAYEIVANMAGPIAEAVEEQRRLAAEEQRWKQQSNDWKQVARLRPAETPGGGAADVRAFYVTAIRPYVRGSRRGPVPDFRTLMVAVPDEWRPKIDRLQAICEEARQLAVQRRLHRLLHGWLFVHAPLSLMLLVLAAFHIVFALRY